MGFNRHKAGKRIHFMDNSAPSTETTHSKGNVVYLQPFRWRQKMHQNEVATATKTQPQDVVLSSEQIGDELLFGA